MRHLRAAALLLCLGAPVLHAASPIKVPLTADHWRPVQDVDNPDKTEQGSSVTRASLREPSCSRAALSR